jgi:mannonate dehydratase
MIRYYGGKKKIFKVHFRNVTSPLPRFREAFVDNGYLDMYQVMKALRDVDYDSVVIPDHVPGETGRGINTSYIIGYMRALRDRANADHKLA